MGDDTINENILLTYKDRLKVGSLIEAKGELEPFRDSGNFGQFSSKDFMRSKGIFASLFLKTSPKILDLNYNKFFYIKNNVVEKLNNINSWALKKQNADFVNTVFFAKNFMDDGYKDKVEDLGLSHILAVSGMHIGIIYLFLCGFLSIFPINYKIRIFFFLFDNHILYLPNGDEIFCIKGVFNYFFC